MFTKRKMRRFTEDYLNPEKNISEVLTETGEYERLAEALDEAEAEALWEDLLTEADDAVLITMLFYPEEGDPLPGLDPTAATGFPDGYRSVFVYEDGSAVLRCDDVTYTAAAGEADFAAIAAFIAENG